MFSRKLSTNLGRVHFRSENGKCRCKMVSRKYPTWKSNPTPCSINNAHQVYLRSIQAVYKSSETDLPKHTFLQLDDRQITHLICVRLKHLLYDFF